MSAKAASALLALLLSLAAFAIGSCNSGGGSMGEAPYGLQAREIPDLSRIPVPGASTGSVRLEPVFPSLSFVLPLAALFAPGETHRLFVVEQGGIVYSIAFASPSKSVFLDLSATVIRSSSEEGLLSLAFEPAFATNGHFYVHYCVLSPSRRTVLSRFTADGARAQAIPSSELVILEVDQPYPNHKGGTLLFGSDGHLYYSLGDGGSGGDPFGHGQNLSTLLGSILRIDVRNSSAQAKYAIPQDNPFVSTAGARPEIYAYGLRNPWRMSFDRQTGELWCGDVGQDLWEEVDVIEKGGNYGWNIMEGNRAFRVPGGGIPPGLKAPVFDYTRSEGASVTGGYVYRGTALPWLAGAYVYGDFSSGKIWSLRRSGTSVSNELLLDSRLGIASFGEDSNGEILVCAFDGRVYRMVEDGGGQIRPMPSMLSGTGLFSDLAGRVPARGLVPYDVIVPLWSDGAEKERFLAIPGTGRMGFRNEGAWSLPEGSVFVKTFSLRMRDNDPASKRRLETRVLVNGRDRIDGFTYVWNDQQTDAQLLDGTMTRDYSVQDAQGTPRTHRHVFPSRTECNACHTEAAGRVLGIRTEQLNRSFDYAIARDHQIRAMAHVELVTGAPSSTSGLARLRSFDDPTASVEEEARSYLDANCGNCHRPGGTGNSPIDLRFSTPLSSTNLVDMDPTLGDLGVQGAKLVLPGDPSRSVLALRMGRRDAFGMPSLATLLVDQQALVVVESWIRGLTR